MVTMKKINSKRKLALVLVLCGVTLFGVTAYAITTVQIAKGTIAHYEPFNGPAEVAIRKNTFQPGDTGPWHYHPGPVYVILTAGTVTVMEGCGDVKQYSAGDAFYEPAGGVHQVTNQRSEEHTSELQSPCNLVCRLLLEKKKKKRRKM